MAAHRAALDLFDQTSMEELRKKSVHLTGILEGILLEIGQKHQTGWRLLTPADPKARGCQLSLFIPSEGKALFDHISSHGVVADWRNPNVIRMAPVPMYNSYSDLYRLQQIILDFYEET
jgi:kynureninase